MDRLKESVIEFFFPVGSDAWLSILRIGLGLQVILYSWSLRADWALLLTANGSGLIGRDLTEAILDVRGTFIPRLGWLVDGASYFGVEEGWILTATWVALLGAGFWLLLGALTRPAAILAWFLHLCTAKSGDLFSYGMDNFTTIGLFYLMVAPLPDRLSLDARIRKLSIKDPRLHGFHRRVLQLHLCVIYFFGGITKSLGLGWWNGTSIWRAMICPPFNVIRPELIISFRFLLPVMGITVCVVELGYSFFIWPQRTRMFWLVCVIAMHLAIGMAMGLYLFSLIMIVLNLAGFAPGWNLPRLFSSRKEQVAQQPVS